MPRLPALAIVLFAGSVVACSEGLESEPEGGPPPLPSVDGGALPDAPAPALVGEIDGGQAPVDCRALERGGGVCACHEVAERPTTLYLLLDRSGSMGDTVAGTGRTRWSLVRSALLDPRRGVLRKLGGRIAIAAAWFPSPSNKDACAPGREVFRAERGSERVFDDLAAKLASAIPRGATPTAVSLRAAREALAGLPKPAHVLLATDGAPNCGTGRCGVDACTYNLERAPMLFEGPCDDAANCCDPAVISRGLGWRGCVDAAAAEEAAADLAKDGTKVFVLGVPGTISAYDGVLDRLALAGGAPREGGGPRYYAATEPTLEGLEAALEAIAGKVVDSCVVNLEEAVDDPGVTNVLVDGVPVAPDATDGWRWASPSSIELVGATCTKVRAGRVARVQVVVGCRTIPR
jgi:hypothetical protein